VVSVYSARGIDSFRSVDVNAPTLSPATPCARSCLWPHPPDAAGRPLGRRWPRHFISRQAQQILHRFRRYTWSHFESNTGGIGWFRKTSTHPTTSGPTPASTAATASACMPCSIRRRLKPLRRHLCQQRHPWTEVTGPTHTRRPLQHPPRRRRPQFGNYPNYVDMTCAGSRLRHHPNKDEEAPRLGFSAAAFDLLNHPNPRH